MDAIDAKTLGEQVQRDYHIRRCVVVDVPSAIVSESASEWASDATHHLLALRAASWFEETYRPEHQESTPLSIGIGMGRAVAMTCWGIGDRNVGRHPQNRVQEAEITPLTGFLSSSLWGQAGDQCDSGVAATGLSRAFARPVMHTVPFDLALNPAWTEQRGLLWFLDRYCPALSPSEWKKGRGCPHLIIAGVGVLAGSHRMVFRRDLRELRHAATKIDDLVALVRVEHARQTSDGEEPQPVFVDFLNRLHHLALPEWLDDKEAEIGERMTEINRSLLTITDDHLQLPHVQDILVVAGGVVKWPAIELVLRKRFYRKITLCTDRPCATNLIRAASDVGQT